MHPARGAEKLQVNRSAEGFGPPQKRGAPNESHACVDAPVCQKKWTEEIGSGGLG